MLHYIDKSALVAEIERRIEKIRAKQRKDMLNGQCHTFVDDASVRIWELNCIKCFIDTLEVKEVDLEKESELIANGIMIDVQANKYNTVVYNTKRNDFNHSHLMLAARKGIELGLKAAQKGEKV